MLLQRGKPWHKYYDEMVEAFDYYSFAMQFGWTDEYVDKLKNERPERYSTYKAILKGTSMAKPKR